MNNQLLLEAERGDDDGYRLHRDNFNESQTCWIEEQIDAMRSGRLHLEVFKDRLRRRDFAGVVPFARETMTVSDFPLMMIANVADRALLAAYNEAPAEWMKYVKLKVNSDLKDAELYALDGGANVLDPIAEQAPYPEAALSEAKYAVRVGKYGRKFRFSWEAYLNDGLRAFDSVPAIMGRAARRTEDTIATKLFASTTGIAALYTTGNKNQVVVANGARTANPAFGVDGVIDMLTVMANQVDSDGQPIVIQGVKIVYPSTLEGTAMQLRKMLENRANVRAGDSNNLVVTGNLFEGLVEFVPNHQIPIVGGSNKATGFFGFADPNQGRPALVLAKLMGHETPDMFMKSPNAVRIGGGGLVDPLVGDFDTDTVAYKVRHMLGGIRVDAKATAYSNGTGS